MKYPLRMGALSRASGLPASAIRFYLKQGLLPEPERPTPNSALYGPAHVQALADLRSIKKLAPELPVVQLKRVMELVSQGVEPEVALSLHRSVAQGLADAPAGKTSVALSQDALARRAGVESAFIDSLVADNILVPMLQSGDTPFNEADVQVVQAVASLQRMNSDGLAAVAQVAALLRKASAIEMQIRNVASQGQSPDAAARISGQMQEWGNFWHAYLFARFRLLDIAQHGLGETRDDT